MSIISEEINKNNAWYQLGKEFARVCIDTDLDDFLKINNLYTTINAASRSSFREGTFEKLILILDEKNVDTAYVKEMYLDYNNISESNTNGYDRYSFYWGYDVEKMLQREYITFSEASNLWNLSDATLRMAVSRGKFKEDVDYRKSGKVWLITKEAMTKIYGEPKK